jgi:hypothetical protein
MCVPYLLTCPRETLKLGGAQQRAATVQSFIANIKLFLEQFRHLATKALQPSLLLDRDIEFRGGAPKWGRGDIVLQQRDGAIYDPWHYLSSPNLDRSNPLRTDIV